MKFGDMGSYIILSENDVFYSPLSLFHNHLITLYTGCVHQSLSQNAKAKILNECMFYMYIYIFLSSLIYFYKMRFEVALIILTFC